MPLTTRAFTLQLHLHSKAALAERRNEDMDRIYTISNYYDGPIDGVASVNGEPHIYKCIFDEKEDEYLKIYSLQLISIECFDLFMEQWGIWLRWEVAFKRGVVAADSHPALPEERKRNEELNELINSLTQENNAIFKTLKAEFMLPETPSWASLWQVKWHETNT